MLVDQVVAAVRAVERACSRFDPSAELARWNRSVEPFVASDLLVEVLDAAMWGVASTDGRFDPRVHDALCALGYDRTFAAVRERTAIPQWRSPNPSRTRSLVEVPVSSRRRNFPSTSAGSPRATHWRWQVNS